MESPILSSQLTAAEVMQRWPATIPVFIRYCTACVGCPFAPFEPLAEIPAIYGLPLDDFMRDLQQAIDPIDEPTEASARFPKEDTSWQT
jgi:hybrid cluster-associated redox disulfide protein